MIPDPSKTDHEERRVLLLKPTRQQNSSYVRTASRQGLKLAAWCYRTLDAAVLKFNETTEKNDQ